jgi:hypothetical protein
MIKTIHGSKSCISTGNGSQIRKVIRHRVDGHMKKIRGGESYGQVPLMKEFLDYRCEVLTQLPACSIQQG